MATDICLESGLRLARLGSNTLARIKEKMPSWAYPGNPLDVEPLSEIVTQEGAYRLGLDAVLSDPGVDLALLVMSTLKMPRVHANFLLEVTRAHPEKPIAVCIIGEAAVYTQFFRIMEEANIPVFVSVRRAVASLAALYRYRRFRDSLT
jgi:acyl-CoA synthetase (NDP forming)